MTEKTKRAKNVELFDENGDSRGHYSLDNRLNNLTGREWVYWSKSVITQPYPSNLQHKLRSSHGAQKPPDLCADLIRAFTKEGEMVLDPFAGVGGVLLGATRAGRKAVGIEVNPEWIDIYREVCTRENMAEERMILGDSSEELLKLPTDSYDFILTDVPFWAMDKNRKSKGRYKKVGQSSKENRRSKLSPFNRIEYENKNDWLTAMEGIFAAAIGLLKQGKYLAVFIGDMYYDRSYHFLTADLASMLEGIGLTMKANIIWYDGSKSLHVYGYRYEYIPSMIHQSILVFRREQFLTKSRANLE